MMSGQNAVTNIRDCREFSYLMLQYVKVDFHKEILSPLNLVQNRQAS